jgi:adenine phosphoribosyltransferase
MAALYRATDDAVAGIEARGFILGGAVADRLSCGFIPIRKKGKLPWKTIGQQYSLEYGVDIIEIHEDAIKPGERILIVDDVIATGGTAEAAAKLISRTGGLVAGAAFLSICRITGASTSCAAAVSAPASSPSGALADISPSPASSCVPMNSGRPLPRRGEVGLHSLHLSRGGS